MLGRFSASLGGTTPRFFILPQIPDTIVSAQRLPMREDRILSTQRLPVCEDRILSIQRYVARAEMNLSTYNDVSTASDDIQYFFLRAPRGWEGCAYMYMQRKLYFYDTLHVLIHYM